MCGVAGFFQSEGLDADRARRNLHRMTEALAHRGPDDTGVWLDPEDGIALGHRRLAVIDPTERGHQPMVSRRGRYVISYNGEIYNYRHLKGRLESRGIDFTSDSDTEVLLTAIEEWGLRSTLELANGMFAFALWDRERRELSLARDRFGEKPLYYGKCGQLLFFGSELKALHEHPDFRPQVDRSAVAAFVRYGYVPCPLSIYKGIQKLAPAEYVQYRRTEKKGPHSYWSLQKVVDTGRDHRWRSGEEEAAERLEDLLRSAVRDRMVADVPLGALLSGGIDSSTTVALMQAESTSQVRTFTIGFSDDKYDEAPDARRVAEYLGTAHKELYVSAEEARAVIPRLPFLYDEPFADASQIPTFLVSQLAREEVTVALTGDGGDEVFGGYSRYFWFNRVQGAIRWTPSALRMAVSKFIRSISSETWDGAFRFLFKVLPGQSSQQSPSQKLMKLADFMRLRDPTALFSAMVSRWNDPESFVKHAAEPETLPMNPRAWPVNEGFVQQMMYVDARTYLPDDILVKTDRASMGVGLEVRAPFLDSAVVDFAWRLPPSFRVSAGKGKRLLRKVLRRYVPPRLTDRPKAGFTVPVGDWLRGPLRGWAEGLLDHERLRSEGMFHPEPIRQCWSEHLEGRAGRAEALWNVLMFQAWHSQWQGFANSSEATAPRDSEFESPSIPLQGGWQDQT